MSTPYDRKFFTTIDEGARNSAAAIVALLMQALAPTSVVDVGCGTGIWLATFQAAGVQDVLGLDGAYVDRSALEIAPDRFQPVDLNQPLRLDRTFDLAISLEVAEHLHPDRSESFVEDLLRLAPVVCFSAAVPHQRGVDHINERWQDEWAHMFSAHAYRPVDLVRKRVWSSPDVESWYAQNLLVYVAADSDLHGDDLPLRLVHPRRFEELLTRPLSVGELARETRRSARALASRTRRRMRR
jgi:SAM-dependent methyltransferase